MIRKRLREYQTRDTIERFMIAAIQSGKDWEEAADAAVHAANELYLAVEFVLYGARSGFDTHPFRLTVSRRSV